MVLFENIPFRSYRGHGDTSMPMRSSGPFCTARRRQTSTGVRVVSVLRGPAANLWSAFTTYRNEKSSLIRLGTAPSCGTPAAGLLSRRCLSAAYQPIVDTARGTVVGYEALARFPGFAEKNPETWFAAARRRGKAEELEAAALRTALAARATLPPNCFLTLNVSPELLPTESIRSVWLARRGKHGRAGHRTDRADTGRLLCGS
jgi:hypothetical protein